MDRKAARLDVTARACVVAALAAALASLGTSCSAERQRLVYEVAPGRLDETLDVLRARMGRSQRASSAGDGRIHVDFPVKVDVASMRWVVEAPGELEVLVEAAANDWGAVDREQAMRDFLAWIDEHPGSPPSVYPAPAPEDGGPPSGIVLALRPGVDSPAGERAVALARPSRPEWRYTQADLAQVSPVNDEYGLPALLLELSKARVESFGAYTGAHLDRQLAVVLDGVVLSMATIAMPLAGKTEVSIRQYADDPSRVMSMARILRAGPLPAPLRFVEAQRLP